MRNQNAGSNTIHDTVECTAQEESVLCRSVSTRQLQSVEMCKGPLVAALSKMSVEVHAGVVAAADRFFLELRRR